MLIQATVVLLHFLKHCISDLNYLELLVDFLFIQENSAEKIGFSKD